MCCSPDDMFLTKGDFNGSLNVYKNKAMKGTRFRLILDNNVHLEPGVQWNYLPAGGFTVEIPGFEMKDDTLLIVQFY